MPMRGRVRCSVLTLATLALTACGGGRPIRYYTVNRASVPAATAQGYPITILIGHIGAPEFLQDEPVAYRSGQNEVGTYQYHYWSEPPVHMVKVVLIRRLRDSGRYQSVSELGSSAQGDFVLHGRLDDFEEVDTGGTAALVALEFELIDRKVRKTVWRQTYTHSEPVQGREVSDVVAALDHNLNQGITEIISGLDAYFAANVGEKK